ncbi:sensor histidine kinase [Stenotrophomonas sp. NPDC101269]|uniref:sensor histidine kinase n=1 Tax=Stenotrophomonas TaxID=40323 RepID=UPI0002EB3C39|nr:histidine kinase [Stenotrophomonas sp.]MBD3825842.1 two-component sensor histidine kinase [Stenotrophomonas sp.]
MPAFLRTLVSPLSLAGLLTLLGVGLSLGLPSDANGALRWGVLGAFIALFLAYDHLPARSPLRLASDVLQALLALWLAWLEPRVGTVPVLLVVLVAHLAEHWPPRPVLAATLLLNISLYAVLRHSGFSHPLLIVTIYAGFQAFAALTAHYARSAGQARDALARVNADLLATRALLADGARDAERLRLARELHDVAGHKLTAMRLNLRALATEPMLAHREPLLLAERLSGELLGDIRQVVQSMRDDRGLDLATALQALAAPFPRPGLRLRIAEQVRITNPLVADAVVRLAQEALTNAARHGDASTVWLDINKEDHCVRIDIRDDGQRPERIREGNGITGMRERLADLQGQLELARTDAGGMHLTARLPA